MFLIKLTETNNNIDTFPDGLCLRAQANEILEAIVRIADIKEISLEGIEIDREQIYYAANAGRTIENMRYHLEINELKLVEDDAKFAIRQLRAAGIKPETIGVSIEEIRNALRERKQ